MMLVKFFDAASWASADIFAPNILEFTTSLKNVIEIVANFAAISMKRNRRSSNFEISSD